jgi:predicted transcriptional regulator
MAAEVKQAVRELLDRLPDECTWDDVMSELYVRQKIAAGLADVEAGRVVTHEEVFAEFSRDEN